MVPEVKYVDRKKQNEIILSFNQLGKSTPEIAMIGVVGPWKRKTHPEKREPISGYECGESYSHVVICTNRTLEEKWLKPLTKNKSASNTIRSLNNKGIQLSVGEVLLRQYEGMGPKELLEYTFGISEIEIAYDRSKKA